MWTDLGWFIHQLEVGIYFWSLYLSFSTLYSKSLWRTDTIFCAKLDKPPPPDKPPASIKPSPQMGLKWISPQGALSRIYGISFLVANWPESRRSSARKVSFWSFYAGTLWTSVINPYLFVLSAGRCTKTAAIPTGAGAFSASASLPSSLWWSILRSWSPSIPPSFSTPAGLYAGLPTSPSNVWSPATQLSWWQIPRKVSIFCDLS